MIGHSSPSRRHSRFAIALLAGMGVTGFAIAEEEIQPEVDAALQADTAPISLQPSTNEVSESEADAKLRAIEAELSAEGVEGGSEFDLSLYGFADFGYQLPLSDSVFRTSSTFAVGKLNLYAAAELGDNWRSLAEVRFMFLPNGATPVTPGANRTDTAVPDHTDFGRPVRWGGISIERVWVEHTFHPLLTLRLGQWLTPFGIWNVDHGSPVIIGVRRPFVIGEGLFPERQTGIEAYGSLGLGASQVGYHLTLSNGRGAVEYQDYDEDKAVGARLYYTHDGAFGTLTLGLSGYRGKYSEGVRRFGLDGNGKVISTKVIDVRYDEVSWAADLKWEWSGFLLQSEAVSNDVAYSNAHRPPAFSLSGGPPGLAPDHRRFGVYGLTGYRTSFLGIMPWLGGEFYDPGLRLYTGPAYGVWAGINARPTPRVVLKAQYTHGWFPEDAFEPINLLDFQAAWSF